MNENALSLRVYEAVSLNMQKYGWVRIESSLPISDMKQISEKGRTRTSSGSISVWGISSLRSALVYWSAKAGVITMKHANAHISGPILFAFQAGAKRTGVFYFRDKKNPLALVVFEHESNPSHVKSKPLKFDSEISSLLRDLFPEGDAMKKLKAENFEDYVKIHNAFIHDTDLGPVLNLLVSAPRTEVAYCVTAALNDRSSWQRWSVNPLKIASIQSISAPDGTTVHLFYAGLHPSRLGRDVLPNEEKSVEERFTCTMERVVDGACDAHGTAFPTSDVDSKIAGCFSVEETVLVLTVNNASAPERKPEMRFYETPSIRFSKEEWLFFSQHPVLLSIDNGNLLLTALIRQREATYAMHVGFDDWKERDTRNTGNSSSADAGCAANSTVLRASCKKLPGVVDPISFINIDGVAIASRPNRTLFTLVLSRDLKLYACEVFGNEIKHVTIENSTKQPIRIPQTPPLKAKKKSGFAPKFNAEKHIKLIRLPNGEALVSNGETAFFISIAGCQLDLAAPSRHLQCPSLSFLENSMAMGTMRAYGQKLERNLATIQEMIEKKVTSEALMDHFASEVLPSLRFLGSAVKEVQLIHLVYRYLIEVAAPESQAEWMSLWELTRFVQAFIGRRHRDTALKYMDSFFLQLVDLHQKGIFSSSLSAGELQEGLLNVISDEWRVTMLNPASSARVEFFFAALADRPSFLKLAENLLYRFATVKREKATEAGVVFSSGYASEEAIPILHAMGFILISSCLDLPVYLTAINSEESTQSSHIYRIKCDFTPSVNAALSVYVPPQEFTTQEEFNEAMVIAADLLSIGPVDQYSSIEAAFFAVCISRRYHCAASLFKIFAPIVNNSLARAAPLCNNREWFEECVLGTSLNMDEEWKRVLARADGKHPIFPTLCFALGQSSSTALNTSLCQLLRSSLPEEAFGSCIIVQVFSLTESMVGAVNNHACAVMRFLSATNQVERDREIIAIEALESRLQVALYYNNEVWKMVHSLMPYKAQDIAKSYVFSLKMSNSTEAPMELVGTMMSRTLVMCFRLFVLISFLFEATQYLDETRGYFEARMAKKEFRSTEVVETPEIERLVSCLRYLFLTDSSALPKEWYHHKLIIIVKAASECEVGTSDPATSAFWPTFLLRLMDLSGIAADCSVAGLKKEYFEIVDDLRARSQVQTSAAMPEILQRYLLAAEDLSHTARLQRLSNGGGRNVDFIFSHPRDASLPRWVFEHNRKDRSFWIASEWTHRLWSLEREWDESLMESVVMALGERINVEGQESPAFLDAPSESVSVGPTLGRGLFGSINDQLYTVKPTDRGHSLPNPEAALLGAHQQPTCATIPPPTNSFTTNVASLMPKNDQLMSSALKNTGAESAPLPAASVDKSQNPSLLPLPSHEARAVIPPVSDLLEPKKEEEGIEGEKKRAFDNLPQEKMVGDVPQALSPDAIAWWESPELPKEKKVTEMHAPRSLNTEKKIPRFTKSDMGYQFISSRETDTYTSEEDDLNLSGSLGYHLYSYEPLKKVKGEKRKCNGKPSKFFGTNEKLPHDSDVMSWNSDHLKLSEALPVIQNMHTRPRYRNDRAPSCMGGKYVKNYRRHRFLYDIPSRGHHQCCRCRRMRQVRGIRESSSAPYPRRYRSNEPPSFFYPKACSSDESYEKNLGDERYSPCRSLSAPPYYIPETARSLPHPREKKRSAFLGNVSVKPNACLRLLSLGRADGQRRSVLESSEPIKGNGVLAPPPRVSRGLTLFGSESIGNHGVFHVAPAMPRDIVSPKKHQFCASFPPLLNLSATKVAKPLVSPMQSAARIPEKISLNDEKHESKPVGCPLPLPGSGLPDASVALPQQSNMANAKPVLLSLPPAPSTAAFAMQQPISKQDGEALPYAETKKATSRGIEGVAAAPFNFSVPETAYNAPTASSTVPICDAPTILYSSPTYSPDGIRFDRIQARPPPALPPSNQDSPPRQDTTSTPALYPCTSL